MREIPTCDSVNSLLLSHSFAYSAMISPSIPPLISETVRWEKVGGCSLARR